MTLFFCLWSSWTFFNVGTICCGCVGSFSSSWNMITVHSTAVACGMLVHVTGPCVFLHIQAFQRHVHLLCSSASRREIICKNVQILQTDISKVFFPLAEKQKLLILGTHFIFYLVLCSTFFRRSGIYARGRTLKVNCHAEKNKNNRSNKL